MKRVVIAFASVLVLAASSDAFAANACVSAADKGQDLRSAGKLDEARATFLGCAKSTCNRVVRADCERWIKEIDEQVTVTASDVEEEQAAPAAAPAAMPRPKTIVVAEPPTTAAFPVAPVVLGGVGVLSLAAFGWFQLQGWSQYSTLDNGCGRTQTCSDAEIAKAESQFVASGAALGVSVVSFGVAAILYFTRGSNAAPSRVGVAPGGAALSF